MKYKSSFPLAVNKASETCHLTSIESNYDAVGFCLTESAFIIIIDQNITNT
jgi:hypothetical protein